ncbi:isochorismatase family protein [Arthrobacter sulfonylureivorans]|uniref:isochorismatase family protein n=1 Tax=Arthrobacter sulfonylureivorans TaxID=2486855 RepID=UPI0039E6B9E9
MWSIDAARSALLMIDMQNDFVLEGAPMEVPMARKRLPEMVTAVAACRQAGIPVIYTRHVLLDSFDVSPLETTYNQRLQTVGMRRGTNGVEVVEELKPEADDYVLDKHRYDAFHNTPLKSVLATIRGLNTVDTVIIAGTLTEVCCESTARSAYMNDYKVAFLSDATGGRSEAAQNATLDAIGTFFGRVLSTADMEREIGTTA